LNKGKRRKILSPLNKQHARFTKKKIKNRSAADLEREKDLLLFWLYANRLSDVPIESVEQFYIF